MCPHFFFDVLVPNLVVLLTICIALRYSTTQFVTTLLNNKSSGLQDAILLSPMGILRLMDLLGTNRIQSNNIIQ